MNTVTPVTSATPVSPVKRGRRRLSVACAAASAAALLLAGCDSDGTGVEDAGSHDDSHTDTALSSELDKAPNPTPGAPQPTPGAPQPTPGATVQPPAGASDTPQSTAPGDATAVSYGNYLVPLGADGSATLTCSFNAAPADEGFAWACEAPVHLGWQATDGGEANSVAYRPGAAPEVYALLGNSGVTATDTLAAGTSTPVGDRYTVDTTGDGTTVTDTSTGVAVRMADGGYSQL
jgi:hypothetical protein